MFTKVLLSAAAALSVAVGVAMPAGADPGAFGALSCSCAGQISAAVGAPTVLDQMHAGIESGLADLKWVSG